MRLYGSISLIGILTWLVTWLVLAPATWSQTPAGGDPVANAKVANTKVVVLRNGNILVGQVDLLGDAYRVATGTSEIRLPASDVERVVDSLLEAYESKRSEVRAGSASDNLRLAAWCIRQEMWPQAARELNDARQADPRHPSIPLLQRRLQVASRAAMRASQPVPLPTPDPEAEREAEAKKALYLQELESLALSLPNNSFEEFARHIQPILVNGCAAAGCHSMEDGRQLRLSRDLLRGIGNRESTLRNLKAVWGAIDPQSPDYSPLLTQPAVPHGGLERPVFTGNRERLQERLANWVRTATRPSQQEKVQGIELATHEQMADATGTPNSAASADDLPHFWEVGPDGEPVKTQVQRGLKQSEFKPQDEFDPEIFNRQQPATESEEG